MPVNRATSCFGLTPGASQAYALNSRAPGTSAWSLVTSGNVTVDANGNAELSWSADPSLCYRVVWSGVGNEYVEPLVLADSGGVAPADVRAVGAVGDAALALRTILSAWPATSEAQPQAEALYDVLYTYANSGFLPAVLGVDGLASPDNDGIATLVSRLTVARAGKLDNLDVAVSSRSTYAGGAVASVTGSVGSIAGVSFPTNFGALGINASGHVARVTLADTATTLTNAPGNSAGVTDLLSRVTTARAGYLDKLNVTGALAHTDNANTFKADVSGLMLATSYVAPNNSGIATLVARPVAPTLTDIRSGLATSAKQDETLEAIESIEAGGGSGNGNGDLPIDHDYGGTDALQLLTNGQPLDDALISAWASSAYGPGVLPDAQTRTGSDGRWVAPLMLDAGAYVVIASKPGKVSVRLSNGSDNLLTVGGG